MTLVEYCGLRLKNHPKEPQREWKGKEKLDDEMRQELMSKNIFFNCRDPWVPGHRCMSKGDIHYIEVAIDSVGSEEEEKDSVSTSSEEE
jgi:hypothetical protein